MTLTEVATHPATTSAIGAAFGGFVSGLAFVRRKMRKLAKQTAREVVAHHALNCPYRLAGELEP